MRRIKISFQLVFVLFAGILLGSASTAFGTSPSSTIYGCVGSGSSVTSLKLGNRNIPPDTILRVTNASGNCSQGETPVNFSNNLPIVTTRPGTIVNSAGGANIVTANAYCLPGESVLGGGYDTNIDYQGFPLLIRFNKPVTNLVDENSNTVQGWSVQAQNPPSGWSNGSIIVQAYAVCST